MPGACHRVRPRGGRRRDRRARVGFEPARRAKLAARTARGRPGPTAPFRTRLHDTGHRTVSGAVARRQQSPLDIATKLDQHKPHATRTGIKLALLAQNDPISSILRTQGELCPVCVANKPSRAIFLPYKPQHHHRHERNNTPTQHTKPRDERLSAHAPHTAPHNETFIAPARHKQAKFTHFHRAGANFLSQHTPHTHTGATFLSTNAYANKIGPNKTFINFDSATSSKPDCKDIGDGAAGLNTMKRCTRYGSNAPDSAAVH